MKRITQVDTGSTHAPDGRLYTPSVHWGTKGYAFVGADSCQLVYSRGVEGNREAVTQEAHTWAACARGNMAVVFSRQTGKVIAQVYQTLTGVTGILLYNKRGNVKHQENEQVFEPVPPTQQLDSSQSPWLTCLDVVLEVANATLTASNLRRFDDALQVLRGSRVNDQGVQRVLTAEVSSRVYASFAFRMSYKASFPIPLEGITRYTGIKLLVEGEYAMDRSPSRFCVTPYAEMTIMSVTELVARRDGPSIPPGQPLPLCACEATAKQAPSQMEEHRAIH